MNEQSSNFQKWKSKILRQNNSRENISANAVNYNKNRRPSNLRTSISSTCSSNKDNENENEHDPTSIAHATSQSSSSSSLKNSTDKGRKRSSSSFSSFAELLSLNNKNNNSKSGKSSGSPSSRSANPSPSTSSVGLSNLRQRPKNNTRGQSDGHLVSHSSKSSSSSSSSSSLESATKASINPLDIVISLYDFFPENRNSTTYTNSQLSFPKNELIYVLEKNFSGWWDGIIISSQNDVKRGWFPQNYVTSIKNSVKIKLNENLNPNTTTSNPEEIARNIIKNNNPDKTKPTSSSTTSPATPRSLSVPNKKNAIIKRDRSSLPYSSKLTETKSTVNSKKNSFSAPTPSTLSSKRPSDAAILTPNLPPSHPSRSSLSLEPQQEPPSSSPSHESIGRITFKDIDPFQNNDNKNNETGVEQERNDIKPRPQSTEYRKRNVSLYHSVPQEKVYTTDEIQTVLATLKIPIPMIWDPVIDTNGTEIVNNRNGCDLKIFYYNDTFDIYTKDLPLLQPASILPKSSIPTLSISSTDHIFEKRNSQKVQDLKKDFKKIAESLSSRNGGEAVNNSIPTSSSIMQNLQYNRRQTISPSPLNIASGTYGGCRSSNKKQNGNNSSHGHFATITPTPIASLDNLFYDHENDIKTCTQLKNYTLRQLELTRQSFEGSNRYEYWENFNKTMSYMTYIQMVCRLLQAQIKSKNMIKLFQKSLKALVNSLTKIQINSCLHFNFMTMEARKQECLKPLYIHVPISKNDSSNSDSNFDFPEQKRPRDHDDGDKTFSPRVVSNSIEIEYLELLTITNSLFRLLQEAMSDYSNKADDESDGNSGGNSMDTLPQLFPRFFKNSFNGTSWKNIFLTPNSNDANIPPYPKLMLDSLATASGVKLNSEDLSSHLNASWYPKFNSSISGSTLVASANGNNLIPERTLRRGTVTTNIFRQSTSSASPTTHVLTSSRSPSHNNIQESRFINTKIPLNRETLQMMSKLQAELYGKIHPFTSYSPLMNNDVPERKKKLMINLKTYEEFNQTILIIELLENLDLTIFLNLEKLVKMEDERVSNPEDNMEADLDENNEYDLQMDEETKEFLAHSFSTTSTILRDFFHIKQQLHNGFINLIICTQNTTLDDPFVFASMKGNSPIGHNEPFNRLDEYSAAMKFMKNLIKRDYETNGSKFVDVSDELAIACNDFIDIAALSCGIVEQLIESRENILNYVARMMQSHIASKLLDGEANENESEEVNDWSQESFNENENEEVDERTFDANRNLVPWYLLPDFENELVYTAKHRVKGGTKDALIEHLTSTEFVDHWYNVTMLLTFRSIFTTREFLFALICRYNIYPPEGLSFGEYNKWATKKAIPVKINVVRIMTIFLEQYWAPGYFEEGLDTIMTFAKMVECEHIEGAEHLARQIHLTLEESKKYNAEYEKRIESTVEEVFSGAKVKDKKAMRQQPILKFHTFKILNVFRPALQSSPSRSSSPFKIPNKKVTYLDFTPVLLAQQSALLEHELFTEITIFECLDRVWGKKYCDMGGSPHITKFISVANNLTNMISTTIIRERDIKQRAKLIDHFIQVAEASKALNNYSSMTAIISGLYSSPIFRLKKTWELVPENSKNLLKELNELMDSKKNFINYRQSLKSVKDVPCIPFFGVYLSDLTFTHSGNPDFLPGSANMINFNKRAKLIDIIEEIISYKKLRYTSFKRNDDIIDFIYSTIEDLPHIEKQYELSLIIEPRTKK
ncbi:uncharacterized protein NDAI_0D02940 [Naumovozyma dairenensis CBS 421]|uniref:Cell division control protein 25 n=1 Tax=Naumovozyma dairenensis (strain ATCC 10597 / BCRC 20456 / CBS 421 / NBRC 0211 / NRRL Y-12639) TaxID=1071378 RepID=G0W9Z7_NAUDC|nr:hypothetical protein NDAI_0D02940 [Naumovozyma dairenensis CBS 421]CCD24608.1 hypothetical protein NDAI_0D02940 [Naumovozyma dairenensis CBS 421]